MSGSFLKSSPDSNVTEMTLARRVAYSAVPVKVSQQMPIVFNALTEQIQNESPESAIRQPPITLDTNKEYFLMPPSIFSVNANVLRSALNWNVSVMLKILFAIKGLQSNNTPPVPEGIKEWGRDLKIFNLRDATFVPNITSTSKLKGFLYINAYLCITLSCNTTNQSSEPIYVNFYDNLGSTVPYFTIEYMDLTLKTRNRPTNPELNHGDYLLVSCNMPGLDKALDRITQSINGFKQQTYAYRIAEAEQQVQITQSRYKKKESENQISESNTERLNTLKLEYEEAERQLALLTRQYEEAKRQLKAKGLPAGLAAKICSMV